MILKCRNLDIWKRAVYRLMFLPRELCLVIQIDQMCLHIRPLEFEVHHFFSSCEFIHSLQVDFCEAIFYFTRKLWIYNYGLCLQIFMKTSNILTCFLKQKFLPKYRTWYRIISTKKTSIDCPLTVHDIYTAIRLTFLSIWHHLPEKLWKCSCFQRIDGTTI